MKNPLPHVQPFTASQLPTDLLGRLLTVEGLTPEAQDVIMDELDARKYDQPQRPSSVDMVDHYLGTKDADDAGAEILKQASDYLYKQIPEGARLYERLANHYPLALAVDQMDELREELQPEEEPKPGSIVNDPERD